MVERLLEERRVLHDELMEIQQPAAVAADSEMTKLKTAVADIQQELTQVWKAHGDIGLIKELQFMCMKELLLSNMSAYR